MLFFFLLHLLLAMVTRTCQSYSRVSVLVYDYFFDSNLIITDLDRNKLSQSGVDVRIRNSLWQNYITQIMLMSAFILLGSCQKHENKMRIQTLENICFLYVSNICFFLFVTVHKHAIVVNYKIQLRFS